MTRSPIKTRLPYLGLLLAFALVLSYVELLLPFDFAVPGLKLGLSNLPVLLCIALFSPADALILAVMKAVLSCLLFGNALMLLYSLAGAAVSCLVMLALFQSGKLHIPVISAAGGVFHNLAQLAVGYGIIRTRALLLYAPALTLFGMATGFGLGIVCVLLLPYIRRVISARNEQS